jgi:hypothetical protein
MAEDTVEAREAIKLSARLMALPWDVRRKIPVPYFNQMSDGTVNFTGISFPKVIRCGTEGLCGICGRDLDYWIAFVGGPVSLKNRVYSDPPFHEDCAKFAMTACPFLSRRVHRRTPEEKFGDDSWKAPEAVMEKPKEWVIGVTRKYRMLSHAGGVLFKTAPMHHTYRYVYNGSGMLEPADG